MLHLIDLLNIRAVERATYIEVHGAHFECRIVVYRKCLNHLPGLV